MNKTKLEIVNISEDVIATSGICSYTGSNGWAKYNGFDTQGNGIFIFSDGDKKYPLSSLLVFNEEGKFVGSGSNYLEMNKHYHLETDIFGPKAYLCENSDHTQASKGN